MSNIAFSVGIDSRRYLIKILLLLTFLFVSAHCTWAQRTTRKGLKLEVIELPVEGDINKPDTLKLPGDLVRISGYEKPLSSKRESFHLTNNSKNDIIETIAIISYLDYQKRELHKRTVKIKADIPAGSTRLLTFPSWDTQNRFYYEGGPVPRKEAYPYSVNVTISHIVVLPNEEEPLQP